MFSLIIPFAAAAILTILIEAVIIIPAFYKHSLNKRQLVFNVILVNAITNITLNLIVYMAGSLRLYVIVAGELVIPVIEGLMYKAGTLKLSDKRIIGICYLANIVSFSVGKILEGLI